MSKIEITQAAEIIKKRPELTPAAVREIIEEMNALNQPADGEESPPALKKQFVVILSESTDARDVLLVAFGELMRQIERCGASTDLTHAVVLADNLRGAFLKYDKRDKTGWVVQIPENASPFSTMDRVFKGAYDFNAGKKKGRMLPVKSVGESLESVSARYFKEAELFVKTKLPVAVIVTDNVLPRDEFKVEKVDRRRRLDDVPEADSQHAPQAAHAAIH